MMLTHKTMIRLTYNSHDQRKQFMLDEFGDWESDLCLHESTLATKGRVGQSVFKRLLMQLQDLPQMNGGPCFERKAEGFWTFQLFVMGVLVQNMTGPVLLKSPVGYLELDKQLARIQTDLSIFTATS